MFIDLDSLEDGAELRCDVLVIGSGAAGITIAREFFGTSTEVLVLEGGGHDPEEETTELNRVENVGDRELTGAWDGRARIVGGTTTLWGGQALPLEASDFEPRSWVPHSGWPLEFSKLDGYYTRALEVMVLDDKWWNEEYWRTQGLEPPGFDPDQVEIFFTKFNRIVFQDQGYGVHDFARWYHDDLEASDNVRILSHAHATCVHANENATNVEHVDIKSLGGKTGKVFAKFYIICCGGIDTPRLLLLSDDVVPNGLGNQNDLVGRFFMEHPIWESGVVTSTDYRHLNKLFILNFEPDKIQWARFLLSEKIQKEQELLKCNANIFFDWHPESGIQAAMELYKGWLGKRKPEEPLRNLWRCIKRPHEVIKHGLLYFLKSTWPCPKPIEIRLQCHVEQVPDPDSRVMLSEERDALGLRKVKMDWKLHEHERRTVLALTKAVDHEFRRLGMGRVDPRDWVVEEGNGWIDHLDEGLHHMGTTRMSDDPKTGVVDDLGKVHGVDNLYISSSSIFPTSGSANSTLTIMALGIRMVDHLKKEL
jgi:choline dehydrogenase-like flavoprotein